MVLFTGRKLYMSYPLHLYYTQRVKHLFNYLHEFELKRDESSLHDLRVEMKKCKALISFLGSFYSKQKLKKSANKLRDIFQKAGNIREYQLMHKWLVHNHFSSFEKAYFPKKDITGFSEDFHKNAREYKYVLKEIFEELGEYIQVSNPILAEQYLADLHAQIEKTILQQPGRDEWHDLRKMIKQLLYAVNWVEPKHLKQEYPFLPQYNKLQEAIGYWHDIEVIREGLYDKKPHLSKDIEIQKEFNKAILKLDRSIRYREKRVELMLGHFLTVSVS